MQAILVDVDIIQLACTFCNGTCCDDAGKNQFTLSYLGHGKFTITFDKDRPSAEQVACFLAMIYLCCVESYRSAIYHLILFLRMRPLSINQRFVGK